MVIGLDSVERRAVDQPVHQAHGRCPENELRIDEALESVNGSLILGRLLCAGADLELRVCISGST